MNPADTSDSVLLLLLPLVAVVIVAVGGEAAVAARSPYCASTLTLSSCDSGSLGVSSDCFSPSNATRDKRMSESRTAALAKCAVTMDSNSSGGFANVAVICCSENSNAVSLYTCDDNLPRALPRCRSYPASK